MTTGDTRSAADSAVGCNGFAGEGFEPVRDVFTQILSEDEIGAAFAAMVDGELVVDLWGGLRDRARGLPWERDTVATIFSGSKGLVATCILRLIEQGALGLEDPVSEHWPEFAANGKRDVLVRHVVSHTAGLPGVRVPLSSGDVADPEKVASLLAAQELFWPPGGRPCYHPLTYGWLCGELVLRVSGRTVGEYLREEITGPLGLEAWIGLPGELLDRVAECELSAGWKGIDMASPPGDISPRDAADIWGNPDICPLGVRLPWNTADWRTAEIPGAGGIASARAMATHYGILAIGGASGEHRILSAESIEAGQEPLSEGIDLCADEEDRFGTGWELPTGEGEYGPAQRAFGHSGAGGSKHGAWPLERAGFSYIMNLMRADDAETRGKRLLAALYDCLTAPEP